MDGSPLPRLSTQRSGARILREHPLSCFELALRGEFEVEWRISEVTISRGVNRRRDSERCLAREIAEPPQQSVARLQDTGARSRSNRLLLQQEDRTGFSPFAFGLAVPIFRA